MDYRRLIASLPPSLRLELTRRSDRRGLAHLVDGSGRLGWVQPIGRAPAAATAADTAEYGAGAFLLAAEQMAMLARE